LKKGFKSGSFNSISFVPADRLASFDDEKVQGGELGVKMRTPGGALRAEAAVYYYKYKDLQVGALELAESQGGVPAPFLRTLNAASAKVKGVDFDMTYVPSAIDGLTINAAVNYNRARYDKFANAPCGNGQTIGEGCNQLLNPLTGRYTAQDLSGRPLVRAPNWSGSASFSQALPVGTDKTLRFGAGGTYSGSYYTVLPLLPGFKQDDFVKLDANISLSAADDSWEVALIGRNLNNKITTGWCANANDNTDTLDILDSM
jgi:iron complex outermembrane receptor protein